MSSDDDDAPTASQLILHKRAVRREAHAKRVAKRKTPENSSPVKRYVDLSDVPEESQPQWKNIWKRVSQLYTFDSTKSNEVRHMVFGQWKQTQYEIGYKYDGHVNVPGLAVTKTADKRFSANKRRRLDGEVTLVC